MRFTRIRGTHATTFIEQIVAWPIAIPERVPIAKIGIDHHWMVEFELGDFSDDAITHFFALEFRAVHPNHTEARRLELSLSRAQPWEGSIAIPTLEGPNIEQHHLPAQCG